MHGMRSDRRRPAIGIDLGTRHALSACTDASGAVKLIPNRWGSTVTPSVIGWNDGWVVGDDALKLSLVSSADVWWDLKRKVGSSFRADVNGRTYTPQELLVPLLSVIREDAEVYLKSFVSSCVLAVPACFSLSQREAMIRAAARAGFESTRIVAEPTAAAFAFGREGRFLVLDFGAGTVDISVVESEGGVWQVLESIGTDAIGGYEFDVALAGWLRECLLMGETDESDPRWRVLLREAEMIKISLSDCLSYHWTPPPLGDRNPPAVTICREDLERLMRFSIRRIIHTVRRLWDRHEPEHLLLVGGSSRIPLLQKILAREVAAPERLSLGAEDAVARGAALYTDTGRERLLLDALSGDLTAVWEGRSRKIIPSEASLPARAALDLETTRSGKGKLELLQSQNEMRRESVCLASVDLDVRAGEMLRLSCELSESGRLAAAVQRGSGEMMSIPLALEGGGMRDINAENVRRLSELKLSLISLEDSLSVRQQNQLNSLFRKAEGSASDPEIMRLLEGLVRDIRAVAS